MKENTNLDIKYLKITKLTFLQVFGIENLFIRSRHLTKITAYHHKRSNIQFANTRKSEIAIVSEKNF